MEDIFTIKVKTKPDTRNVYPSERRYSASTVSGLAWVHLALAVTSFVLACLAIVNPVGGGSVTHLNSKDAIESTVDPIEFLNMNFTETQEDKNFTSKEKNISRHTANEYSWILIIAPSLLTVAALAAGIASIMASSRWYVDRNITWLFLMSVLATVVSMTSFIMMMTWIGASESQVALSQFYKDKVPFKDFIVVPKQEILVHNGSHIIVAQNSTITNEVEEHLITKRVLSINILIACFLEFLWSVLSLKISYKGMNTSYKDDEELDRRSGNCLEIVTTVKGNTKNQRNAKVITPKPDLIDHYPSNNKIKQFLQSESNTFGMKGDDEKNTKPVNESSSEYRERMMNFLNRCASFDGSISNPELPSPGAPSDIVLSTIQEVRLDTNQTRSERAQSSRVSTISWGDPHDHTVYNQNNLDLEKILQAKIEHSPDSVEADGVRSAGEAEETTPESKSEPIEIAEES